ncbi:hypothetical protein L484_007209 [Morus notabilis]|uniref:Uncharacterized protein n=1 Tax=Morus notabilis TaxID=981085 RepID=W9SF77_9ROSA|nr:hypothetical protein L484_007209 [Morus notabilis]
MVVLSTNTLHIGLTNLTRKEQRGIVIVGLCLRKLGVSDFLASQKTFQKFLFNSSSSSTEECFGNVKANRKRSGSIVASESSSSNSGNKLGHFYQVQRNDLFSNMKYKSTRTHFNPVVSGPTMCQPE